MGIRACFSKPLVVAEGVVVFFEEVVNGFTKRCKLTFFEVEKAVKPSIPTDQAQRLQAGLQNQDVVANGHHKPLAPGLRDRLSKRQVLESENPILP